jgi:L-seryl-tRNA(Ser) seleniumtransferase
VESAKGSRGSALQRVATAFRALPVPVIGRISGGAFLLDLRCMDDEQGFIAQLASLKL